MKIFVQTCCLEAWRIYKTLLKSSFRSRSDKNQLSKFIHLGISPPVCYTHLDSCSKSAIQCKQMTGWNFSLPTSNGKDPNVGFSNLPFLCYHCSSNVKSYRNLLLPKTEKLNFKIAKISFIIHSCYDCDVENEWIYSRTRQNTYTIACATSSTWHLLHTFRRLLRGSCLQNPFLLPQWNVHFSIVISAQCDFS